MNLNLLLDTPSTVRLAVALAFTGGVLLLFARLVFGPFPRARD